MMVWFFETEFLCITALAVLELTLYQAGLNLRGPPASASRILGLKVPPWPGFTWRFLITELLFSAAFL